MNWMGEQNNFGIINNIFFYKTGLLNLKYKKIEIYYFH